MSWESTPTWHLDEATLRAYVDGRPMPYSSSAFTSEASEKRGGGSVKCWSATTRLSGRRSPVFIAGSLRPSSSSSALFVSLPSS